jgi:hypothetical protein
MHPSPTLGGGWCPSVTLGGQDNRLHNEFFLVVLQYTSMHEWQSLGTLQFTSDEPQFVKDMVERIHPAAGPRDSFRAKRPSIAGD